MKASDASSHYGTKIYQQVYIQLNDSKFVIFFICVFFMMSKGRRIKACDVLTLLCGLISYSFDEPLVVCCHE